MFKNQYPLTAISSMLKNYILEFYVAWQIKKVVSSFVVGKIKHIFYIFYISFLFSM